MTGVDEASMKSGHRAVKDEACRLMQTPCVHRVPASSGPNLPGARTGAAATPRAHPAALRRAVPVSAASPHGAWRRYMVGGGCSGGGTEGAASCCLRRSWVHLSCMYSHFWDLWKHMQAMFRMRQFWDCTVFWFSPLQHWPWTVMVAAQQGHSCPSPNHSVHCCA